MLALMGCSGSHSPATTTAADVPSTTPPSPPQPAPDASKRELASDPVQLADDLVADERALRDPASPEDVLTAAAHRQQAAYRLIGRHPEWDPIARPRIPASLLEIYDRNIDARRQLTAMSGSPSKTRCLRGTSSLPRLPTSCWVTTTKRRRRPASAGTTWRRST